jgi:hypothetical protein
MTTYAVEVRTGKRDYAGTDAKVYIQLIGARGTTPEMRLDNPEDNFEKGKLDKFRLQADDVGWIDSIRIFHDNSNKNPGWYLDYVNVINQDLGVAFKADFYRWLARDEADKKIDVSMAVPIGPVSLSKGNIVSYFMGYNTMRRSNQSSTTTNFKESFSFLHKQGMSLKKTSGWSINASAKVGAEFFGLKCEFTTGVTRSITSEFGTYEEQLVQASSELQFTLGPSQAITAASLYFQNILEGEATANGVKMEFEQKFLVDADVVIFDGLLSDAEVSQAIKTLLGQALASAGGGAPLPQAPPMENARIAMARRPVTGALTAASLNAVLPTLPRRWLRQEHLATAPRAKQLTSTQMAFRPARP